MAVRSNTLRVLSRSYGAPGGKEALTNDGEDIELMTLVRSFVPNFETAGKEMPPARDSGRTHDLRWNGHWHYGGLAVAESAMSSPGRFSTGRSSAREKLLRTVRRPPQYGQWSQGEVVIASVLGGTEAG